mmetsp:Transcript_132360/g.257888  ORF Transcript_132360/g.257888 Transcript_132360/m.257888 type:complete len:128 (+) Transcript_132360:50-433(+)
MHRLLRHYSAKMQCRAILVVGLFTLASGLKVDDLKKDPAGPGQAETTMGAACAECAKSAPYLDKSDDCSCHATDIMRTFENDATKKLTSAKKYGSETVNTGASELTSGWHWHCRPVTATKGVWKQCS